MFRATERWGFFDHSEATKKKPPANWRLKQRKLGESVDRAINGVIMPVFEYMSQIY